MKLGNIHVCYISPNHSQRSRLNKFRFTENNCKKAMLFASICLANANNLMASARPGTWENAQLNLAKVDAAGENLLTILTRIGYWVAIFMAIFEIIKHLKDGDTNGIWGVIVKYGMAFGSLFALPWVFDIIAGLFS